MTNNNAIQFAKLSGSGNDFICIDNRDGRYDEIIDDVDRVGHFARMMCSRGMGIGADGVIFACEPDIEGVSDIAARFYEADGSQAELCGNGTGCFVHWVQTNDWVPRCRTKILTPAGVVRGSNGDGRYVRVCIPDPQDIRFDLATRVDGQAYSCDYVVSGVPHLIIHVDDAENIDIEHLGPAFRHHDDFKPRGVNANFVEVLEQGRLAVRTWEFGVEGETLACGTGSASAAILATLRFGWPVPDPDGDEPVLIRTRSGDEMRIFFRLTEDRRATDVCLETIVRFLCKGQVHPDLAAIALDHHTCAETGRRCCKPS